VQPAGHDHGGPRQLEPVKVRQIRHRRQREPAVGWCGRRRADGSQGRRKRGLQPLGRFVAWAAAGCGPTRWASARCSRCRSC
jgi:hypothetical protein